MQETISAAAVLDKDKSQLLHGLRWLSAVLVVFGHTQIIAPSDSPLFELIGSHGHAAVIVFFVLSGYVISAMTEAKGGTHYSLEDYLLDRFSRIYSVLLPAILLTLLLDSVGGNLAPGRYSNPALIPQSLEWVRILANLFCLQGIWGFRIQLGSNPPLWSIAFELFYYLAFGLLIWKPRHWKAWLAAGACIVGPEVLAYGLIWSLGVIVHRLNRAGYSLPALLTFPAFIGSNYFFEYAPTFTQSQFANDFAFGLSVGFLIMSRPHIPSGLAALNKTMANFSYSLYAYHYPIAFFMGSTLVRPYPYQWGIVFAVLLLAWLLHYPTEAQRGRLRRVMKSLLSAMPTKSSQ